MKSDNYHVIDPEWNSEGFGTFVHVWGKSINEINEAIQHFVENNNIMEQYEKSNKWEDFDKPILEIDPHQDGPRWNSARNQWKTTLKVSVVEYKEFRHS